VVRTASLVRAIHAHLPRLPAQHVAQSVQGIKASHVTRLHLRSRRWLVGGMPRPFRHGVVDHAHVRHAALGWTAAAGLLTYPRRIHAHTRTRLAVGVPVPSPRRRTAQHLPLLQMGSQLLPGRLGRALDRRFRQAHPREFRQNLLGRFRETVGQQARQTHRAFGSRRQALRSQAHDLVPREQTMSAAMAEVIGPPHRQFAQETHGGLGSIPLELSGLLATRAVDAASLVAVFF
jgi:hypothetical protein